MLELYHHGSSACAARVRFALAEKQLEWTGRYVDILAGEQFDPAFVALNPKAVVPVLVDDGRVVTETTVICEYLEDAYPEHPIYPREAYERAQVRLWTKAVDEELHPACSALTYIVSHRHMILRSGAGDFESFVRSGSREGRAARELKWQWIQHGLAAPGAADRLKLYDAYLRKLEAALGDARWLVADRFSMADIALAPYLYRLVALSMEGLFRGGRLPRVERWFDRLRERPAFRSAVEAWMPAEVAAEMRANGRRAWPEIAALVGAA